MEEREVVRLSAELAQLKENRLAKNSWASYRVSGAKFVFWLNENFEQFITTEFKNELSKFSSITVGIIKNLLECKTVVPLHFSALPADVVAAWLLSLRKKNGENLTSALNTHRAGVSSLFKEFNETQTKEYKSQMGDYFQGFRNTLAKRGQEGKVRIKTGKDPFAFPFFKFLVKTILQKNGRSYIFAHTFLLMCWNLMSRATNVFEIRLKNLEWENDQGGERSKHPRAVYANPLNPWICPILSLGIFFLVHHFNGENQKLFIGKAQYDRFVKLFHSMTNDDNFSEEMKRKGVNPRNTGTHSVRKGACRFVSSGSTACPSFAAVNNRAGWSMGKVKNIYLQHEAAGDSFVGRTVAGLPILSQEFSVLPPHFQVALPEERTLIDQALSIFFPNAPENLRLVLEFCLASLVYHKRFLTENLDSQKHPLFSSPLFVSHQLVSNLKKLLSGVRESKLIEATGVPPHVMMLKEMNDFKTQMEKTSEKLFSKQKRLLSAFFDEIDKRQLVTKDLSIQSFKEHITKVINNAVQNLPKVSRLQGESDETSERVTSEITVHHEWNGSFRTVPLDFKFRDCSVRNLFLLWHFGQAELRIVPFKCLTTKDLNLKYSKRRLSDVRCLMRIINDALKTRNITFNEKSQREALEAFEKFKSTLELPQFTKRNRKRRNDQIGWRRTIDLLRKQKRRKSKL